VDQCEHELPRYAPNLAFHQLPGEGFETSDKFTLGRRRGPRVAAEPAAGIGGVRKRFVTLTKQR
jgi:hypothetical protein